MPSLLSYTLAHPQYSYREFASSLEQVRISQLSRCPHTLKPKFWAGKKGQLAWGTEQLAIWTGSTVSHNLLSWTAPAVDIEGLLPRS